MERKQFLGQVVIQEVFKITFRFAMLNGLWIYSVPTTPEWHKIGPTFLEPARHGERSIVDYVTQVVPAQAYNGQARQVSSGLRRH